MRVDEEDLAAHAAAEPVYRRIREFLNFRPRTFTDATIAAIEYIVREEGTRIRLSGRPLPPLVAVFIPERGTVHVLRRDLEHEGIQAFMRMVIDGWPACRADPGVGVPAIIKAIRRAFPGYNPENAAALGRTETFSAEGVQP